MTTTNIPNLFPITSSGRALIDSPEGQVFKAAIADTQVEVLHWYAINPASPAGHKLRFMEVVFQIETPIMYPQTQTLYIKYRPEENEWVVGVWNDRWNHQTADTLNGAIDAFWKRQRDIKKAFS